jgi:hypothetical protein
MGIWSNPKIDQPRKKGLSTIRSSYLP